jgi:hypothetical protein
MDFPRNRDEALKFYRAAQAEQERIRRKLSNDFSDEIGSAERLELHEAGHKARRNAMLAVCFFPELLGMLP